MKHFFILVNGPKDNGLEFTKKMENYIVNSGGTVGHYVTMRDESGEASGIQIPEDTELIFVLGGDGTLIRTSHDLHGLHIPFIGVNLGTLGYLCELGKDTVFDAIDKLMRDEYMLEERMLLKSVDDNDEATGVALNDIVIHRNGQTQLVRLIVYVNGLYLATYNADGIIVATPTGSTGYSMSAGGPIIEPRAQMILLTPINTHTLSGRSIVLSDNDTIEIELAGRRPQNDETASVSYDGDVKCVMKVGERIKITRTRRKVNILKLTRESFWEILQKKMQTYS